MRRHDWPERLHAFIEARRERAFSFGQHDCGLFCADWVLECTGVDVAAKLRGYKGEKGALSRVKKAGGMRELAAGCGLKERRSYRFAQRGDVVLANLEERETFGIFVGNGMYAAPGAEGLVFRPINEALAVFEV